MERELHYSSHGGDALGRAGAAGCSDGGRELGRVGAASENFVGSDSGHRCRGAASSESGSIGAMAAARAGVAVSSVG